MTAAGPTGVRRISVTLHDRRGAAEWLEVAVRLAVRMQAELRGLYVEDIALRQLVELPLAGEVMAGSSQIMALDPGRLARSQRIQAARLQRMLAAVAAVRNVAWSFQSLQGRPITEARAVQLEGELLLLGGGGRRGVSVAEWQRPVTTVFEGGDDPALASAAALADVEARPLLVLIPAPDAVVAAELRKTAAVRLADLGTAGRLRIVAPLDAGGLLEVAVGAGSKLVVLPSRLAAGVAAELLERAPCAVVLVR